MVRKPVGRIFFRPSAAAVGLWSVTSRDMRPVAALFAAQDGLATIGQLDDLGVSRGVRRQRLATGEWGQLGGGVIGLSSAPGSWRRDVRAAVLAAGPHAFASHATAARLLDFDGYDRDERIVVSGASGHHVRSLPGVEVHRSELFGDRHRRLVDGMSCAIEPVALIQIAATDGRDAAARALDSFLRAGRSAEWIRFVASPLTRQRVSGPTVLLELVRERVDGTLPMSWFQRLASRALTTHGIVLVDEHPVHDHDGTLLAALDLADPTLQIGVECQSWRWHASPAAQAADLRRKRRLRRLGWELVEVWWTDLERMDEVAADLGVLIARRTPAA